MMFRPLRIQFPVAPYHVTVRGNAREASSRDVAVEGGRRALRAALRDGIAETYRWFLEHQNSFRA